jgi:hypothetical protein
MKALNWLLLFVPLAIGLNLLAPERYLLIFLASSRKKCVLTGSTHSRRSRLPKAADQSST